MATRGYSCEYTETVCTGYSYNTVMCKGCCSPSDVAQNPLRCLSGTKWQCGNEVENSSCSGSSAPVACTGSDYAAVESPQCFSGSGKHCSSYDTESYTRNYSITYVDVVEYNKTYSWSTTGSANLIAGTGYQVLSNRRYKITGTGTITLNFSVATNCSSSGKITVNITSKKVQVLNYNGPTSCVIGNSYSISVTSTAGLTNFTYSLSDKTAGTITGNIVKFTKAGVYQITVTQAGNSEYQSASVVGVIVVEKKSQTINYTGPKDFIVGVVKTLSAVASSGLSNFTYSVNGNATVLGNQVLFTEVGLYSLTVVESGNNEYEAASLIISLVCGFDNFSPILIAAGSRDEITSGGVNTNHILVALYFMRFLQFCTVRTFIV